MTVLLGALVGGIYMLVAWHVWRWMLRRHVRCFPTLAIDAFDVFFVTLLALLWPAAVPLEFIIWRPDPDAQPNTVVRFARRVAGQEDQT